MDFFNDLGKKFSSVINSVTEKTKESVEASQLSSDLKSARSALEALYAEYGKACYAIYSGSGDAEAAQAVAKRIDEAVKRLEALNAQREELNEQVRCPGCGALQPKAARFCSNCGRRMPEEAPKPEPEAPAEVEYCPDCGAQREGESKFCAVCGRPFEAEPAEADAEPTPAELLEPEVAAMNVEEPDFEGEEER